MDSTPGTPVFYTEATVSESGSCFPDWPDSLNASVSAVSVLLRKSGYGVFTTCGPIRAKLGREGSERQGFVKAVPEEREVAAEWCPFASLTQSP
ncbi:hypothetical protein TREES_T100020466 [Tupaia chinensis]|uniref:Uncharacterized protein n=1 Tax=Tupaia chinensis TaxID=246437 RepID=L9KVQ6_TUPCH|nr:hypothetical protein TREES_T100020466 [Tupaia chinensis]